MRPNSFAWFVCTLFATASALAQPAAKDAETGPEPYTEKQTGLTFPKQIGDLKLESVKDFGEARLGVGIRYRLPGAIFIDTIIYNQGLEMISSDPAAKEVKGEADQALKDVETAASKGFYKDLKVVSREVVQLSKAEGAPQAHKLLFTFTLGDAPRGSGLYLLGHKNQFVKVRATWSAAAKDASVKELDRYLAWLAGEISAKK